MPKKCCIKFPPEKLQEKGAALKKFKKGEMLGSIQVKQKK